VSDKGHPDRVEDPCDAPLIEGVDVEPAATEIGGDVRLEIGERQDEVRPQREDLVDIRRGKGADAGQQKSRPRTRSGGRAAAFLDPSCEGSAGTPTSATPLAALTDYMSTQPFTSTCAAIDP
jgi:hypothetical protein